MGYPAILRVASIRHQRDQIRLMDLALCAS